MAHAHGPTRPPVRPRPVDRRTRRLLALAVAPIVLATAVGLVALWPSGARARPDALGPPSELVDAAVVGLSTRPCAGSAPGAGLACTAVEVRLAEGPDRGRSAAFDASSVPGVRDFAVGDRLVLTRLDAPGVPPEQRYAFADYQRRRPLGWLAALFGAAVVALGRARGVRALVGLGLSLVVLLAFVLPAILDGRDPVAVALVGSAAVMLAALYLAHGFGARTTTAVLGTAASLVLIGVLAAAFVGATRLTGLATEEARYLTALGGPVDVRGLVLAGVVVGSLGVLDDVTVTQASAVWELHRANPGLGPRGLYRAALRIGRDHVASTVNTLVLAYAGASLPLLVLFVEADQAVADVVASEVVATEVVRTLVGSVGLVASVPLTTALAAAVVGREPRRRPARRPRPPRRTNADDAAGRREWAPPKAERAWRGES